MNANADSVPPQDRRGRLTADRVQWIPAGQSAKVAGFILPSGLLYVGTDLRNWRGEVEQDPSLINPKLSVGARQPDSNGPNTKFPSYTTMTPAQRAAYLEWLAGGRCDSFVHSSYVWLFFRGLERRVRWDLKDHPEHPELGLICAELSQLLACYPFLGGYADDLLDLLKGRGDYGPTLESHSAQIEAHALRLISS